MIECALTGTLTRDATSKISKSGKKYLQLNLRIGDGDAAQWVNALVFDTEAIDAAAAGKMVKGTTAYLEGRLSLDEWTSQDGARRQGLSVMARYCRLPEIGRNRPKKPTAKKAAATSTTTATTGEKPAPEPSFYSDPIPF